MADTLTFLGLVAALAFWFVLIRISLGYSRGHGRPSRRLLGFGLAFCIAMIVLLTAANNVA